jgi:hypothetical protein
VNPIPNPDPNPNQAPQMSPTWAPTRSSWAAGIQGKLGNMGLENVKEIYREHNGKHDAETEFTAYTAGHVLKTKARRGWDLWRVPTVWISSSGLLT